ncbi:MAG: sugar transferase [Planctomycetota bacterium]
MTILGTGDDGIPSSADPPPSDRSGTFADRVVHANRPGSLSLPPPRFDPAISMLPFVRSLMQLVGSRTTRPAEGFLLAADRFELAATAERMRVDRNHSVVSLLVIEPSASKSLPQDIYELERRMASRLRLTDTAGWLRDGRIGLLLPDTPESGAWKVAADLCDAYEVGADRPTCEVVVYPDSDRSDDDNNGPGDGGHGVQREAVIDRQEEDLVASAAGQPSPLGRSHRATRHFDVHFVRPMPFWKRMIDITGAAVGLAITGPVIALAAVAVRLTSQGPAFFLQEREGLGGRHFKIYKLRTMRPDAESLKSDLRDSSEQDGPAFKMIDDPRITTVGRLLRRTSIDELPQLWNVLRGDMSLVGPRPLPVDESHACQPWQRRRLTVTPGITCTWQIYGRNVVPFDDWVRMDLEYAEQRSPWLDLKLVAKTGPSLVLPKGR